MELIRERNPTMGQMNVFHKCLLLIVLILIGPTLPGMEADRADSASASQDITTMFARAMDIVSPLLKPNSGEWPIFIISNPLELMKAADDFTTAAQSTEDEKAKARSYFWAGRCLYELDIPLGGTRAYRMFSLSAALGNTSGRLGQALCLLSGKGVEKNTRKCWDLLRELSEEGSLEAAFRLSSMSLRDKSDKTIQEEGLRLLLATAEQGHVLAQTSAGMVYREGDVADRNDETAAYWFRRAAEQRDVLASYILATCYFEGRGVPVDFTEGVKWLTVAANEGYAEAQFAMALACVNGKGTEKNIPAGVNWYRRAAEQNHLESQYRLGFHYLNAIGVEYDRAEAIKWIATAAGRNHANARLTLRDLHRHENFPNE